MANQPRASHLKVALAIVAVPVLTFVGCALVADDGRNHNGRGPWEFNALSAFIMAAVLAFFCYRLAFKKGPSFAVHDDRIEHFRWKTPIYFRDVDEVVFEPGEFWARRGATVYLRLKNGSIQHIPYSLMTHGPADFAEVLTEALKSYRANGLS